MAHLEELLLSPSDPARLAAAAAPVDSERGRRVLLYVDPQPDYQEGAEFTAVAAAVEAGGAGVSCEYVYSESTADMLTRKGLDVASAMRAPFRDCSARFTPRKEITRRPPTRLLRRRQKIPTMRPSPAISVTA
mgnify:CR=1 FL=1